MKQLMVNNLKCRLGQTKMGVEKGGDKIFENFPELSIPVVFNHISFHDFKGYDETSLLIFQQLSSNNFILNLGGDHSIGANTILPLLDTFQDDLLIVWVDAHADVNTFETSLTKNIHGMPVAPLLGLMKHWSSIQGIYRLRPQNLVYIGIRDLDSAETNLLEELHIPYFRFWNKNVQEYLEKHPAKYIHLSLDIDGIDPQYMPSTGTLADKGISIEDTKNIIKTIKPRLVSSDIVEFNPLIGSEEDSKKTLENILEIISEIVL